MEDAVLGKLIHPSHAAPSPPGTTAAGVAMGYLAEEPKDGVDLGVQDMDGGEQLVLVAPEQLVHAAHSEQRLLVQQQQHLRGKLQRGRPGPLHGSLQGMGMREQWSHLLGSQPSAASRHRHFPLLCTHFTKIQTFISFPADNRPLKRS